MMKVARWFGCLSVIAATVATSPVSAVGVAVTNAKIQAIHLESGVPFLFFEQAVGNPDGCASAAVIVLAPDLVNQQYYLSLATTAMASGKPVSIWVAGCGWAPWSPSVPKVYAMQMVP